MYGMESMQDTGITTTTMVNANSLAVDQKESKMNET